MADSRYIGFDNSAISDPTVEYFLQGPTDYLEVRNSPNTILQTGPQGREGQA